MKKSLLLGAGRGPRLAVLERIKRSGEGLSVQELTAALDMSYMGVKAHCLALVATGHLTTRREPSTRGRPRLIYRLAESGEQLFADADNEVALGLLREAAGLYGVTAPQKLLLMFFRTLQARYGELMTGNDLLDRVRALVRLRDREGRMAQFVETASWEIRESHNSLATLMREYPEACALEEHMIGEVLGVPVKRREEAGRVVFSPK